MLKISEIVVILATILGLFYYIFGNLDEELFQLNQEEKEVDSPPHGVPRPGTEEFSEMIRE